LDCAILQPSSALVVLKTDPITFATNEIGWYAVQVNANDIATTGATPRWMLATALLPEGKTTAETATAIYEQLLQACQAIQVSLIGGHTEITSGLDRPILIGMMIGEVKRKKLITPRGAQVGDRILLTKGVPIEATAIIARELLPLTLTTNLPQTQIAELTEEEIKEAQNFLYRPGISVLKDAQLAIQAGTVHAMHDVTEGGLATALWELSQACGHAVHFSPQAVYIPPLAEKCCTRFGIDPFAAISSGALLIAAPPSSAPKIIKALENEGIRCMDIGQFTSGEPAVWLDHTSTPQLLPLPDRDEIARIFENIAA
jgi:hydrogenase maturation factor